MIDNFTFYSLNEVTSTQDVARSLAKEGKLQHALVVTATSQSSGRGRYDRIWVSPEGGLYMTIVLKPRKAIELWSQLSYVVGISLSEAITQIDPVCAPKLKWVNDVLLGSKKVAGILLELLGDDTILIGIGVNIETNASIDEALGASLNKRSTKFSGERLMDVLLRRFNYNYNLWCDKGFEPVRNLWIRMAYGIGKGIEIKLRDRTQVGTFIGVDEMGNLQLLGRGVTIINAGDVFFH